MNLSSRAARTALVLALLETTLLAQSSLKYPQPRKGDVVDDYFGTKIADPYRWMEDLNAADVKQWIDAEIYPATANALLPLTPDQTELLSLFQP